MGQVLLPRLDAGEWEIVAQGPPRISGGAAPRAAMLRALILALLWRGSLAQEPGYSLTVLRSVSVQEGLCVLVPCNFTYPARYDTNNPQDTLYGHWYKGSADMYQDPPVASSDPSRGVSWETRGRFRLAGDPARGDCSLQIDDARWTDEGTYFLRVERGTFKYSYRVQTGYTEPQISVLRLTEEPQIQISPARGLPETLVAGEPVTVTCTAPGRCSGTPPRITWTGPFSDTARDVSAQLENGTTAHSSALSFTPALGDHGKELVCTVTYSQAREPSISRAVSLQVFYPPGPPNITWTLMRNKHPVPGPVVRGAEDDVETQEGDSLTLICEVGSRPVATLSWVKDNVSLSPGPEGVGHLELSNLSRGDAGEYRCWARNPYGSASRALRVHMRVAEKSRWLLGLGVACGLGVAIGCFLLGLCVVKRQSRAQAPSSAAAKETANGTQGEHSAHTAGLIYSNISNLPMDDRTVAARRTKGIQYGAAAAQGPSGPGELRELHYASIDFSKGQHKGGQPREEPATEYSEIQL